jgi:hypothetical protein
MLVAIGGVKDAGLLTITEFLDVDSNTWAIGSGLPLPRTGLAAALDANGDLFAAGGTAVLSDGGLGPTTEVDTLVANDPAGMWVPYPDALALAVTNLMGISADDGYGPYVFGGMTAAGTPTNAIQVPGDGGLDLTSWIQTGQTLPAPRAGAIALSELQAGGLIVLGGVDASGQAAQTVWLATAGNPNWQVLADWPNPRPGAAGAVDGVGFLFIAGGTLPDGGFSDEVDIYDPYNGKWSAGPPLPTPRTGLACGFASGPHRFYCIGGYNGQFLDTVEAYLIDLGTWAHN